MARIKRDPDDWKARGIKKRDFQHSHDAPEVPKHNPKKRNKKDTKRWCRGKEGKEHKVVSYLDNEYLPDFSCCPRTRDEKRHLSWNHRRIEKCNVCGMDSWNLPDEALAQIDERIRLRLKAEAKWCAKEGHLYDWETNMIGPPKAFEGHRYLVRNWRDNLEFKWASRYWEHQICVMCSKRGKTRRRNS